MVINTVLIFLAALLSACAPLASKPGFEAVQNLVATRTPHTLAWPQSTAERQAQQQSLAAALQSPLTLESAVRTALLGNPNLQAEYEKLGMAYGDLVQAGLPVNPALTFSLSSSSIGIGREFGVVQDVLSLLALAPRKRLANAMFDEVKLQTAQQVLALASEVKKAFYETSAAQELLDLETQASATAGTAAELAQRQFDAGNIGTRELALRQEFHARAVLRRTRQELSVAESREQLSRLMALPADTRNWTLAPLSPDADFSVPALNSVEEKALRERFDIAASSRQVERMADALGVADRFRYLSMFGVGLNFSRETDGEKRRGPSLSIGLPLWDRNQGARFRMQAELRESERHLDGLILDARRDVRSAHARLSNAQQTLQHFRATILPLHERIVTETLKFYNGMLLGVYDLLAAKQNQQDAQREYIEMTKIYRLAKVDLELASGGHELSATSEHKEMAQQPKHEPEHHDHHRKDPP
jgi:outer membrane protein, heavy metal efflux system